MSFGPEDTKKNMQLGWFFIWDRHDTELKKSVLAIFVHRCTAYSSNTTYQELYTIVDHSVFSLSWVYYLGAWLGTWGKLPNLVLELGPSWQVRSALPRMLCHLHRMQRQRQRQRFVLTKRTQSPITTRKLGRRSASFRGKLRRFDVCKPIFSPLRCSWSRYSLYYDLIFCGFYLKRMGW